jgi:2-polyprenyl-3-methyl-5-hydroxy-6-metoxy-1,4-benzoquinol methylase
MAISSEERIQKSDAPNHQRVFFGALVTQMMMSGVQLGVFQKLAEGPATVEALARAAGAKERGLRMLLDALVAIGQLERTDGLYRLPEAMQALLAVPGVDAETYFADWLNHSLGLTVSWPALTEVVRTGKSADSVVDPEVARRFFVGLARMLFPQHFPVAQALFEKMKERFGQGEVSILDVACGGAPWSMPFAVGNPEARVTGVDYETVLEVAKHYAHAHGAEKQYSYLIGDLRDLDLGAEEYDLALLGHICHSEGERHSRGLFRKVYEALKPGGIMAVADFVADDERLGKGRGDFALLFALNMLVHTPEGGTFTWAEYQGWGKEAGFGRAELVEVPAPSPMMVFHKPA